MVASGTYMFEYKMSYFSSILLAKNIVDDYWRFANAKLVPDKIYPKSE